MTTRAPRGSMGEQVEQVEEKPVETEQLDGVDDAPKLARPRHRTHASRGFDLAVVAEGRAIRPYYAYIIIILY